MGGSSSSKQTSQSQTSYDPQLKDAYLANYSKAQQTAATPVQAYSGPLSANFDGTPMGQAQGGFADLASYQAPRIAGVDISQYMNPFDKNVVDATSADLSRQYGIDSTNANAQATSAGAFGGSRSAVLSGLVNDNYQRNLNSTLANLHQQGYSQAQGLAAQDSANSLASAGIRSGANAGLAGIAGQQQQVQQSGLQAAYQEWLRQQNWPLQMQQLLTQAAGALPNGTVGTSNSTGKSSSFQITPPNVSIG